MREADKRYWRQKLRDAEDLPDLIEIIKGILNDLPDTEEEEK